MTDAAISYQGLHHLALVSSDMARTVDFYTNVLGMKLKKGFDLDRGYGQHFFFDMGGGNELAFFWFRDAPPPEPGVSGPRTLMNHVAFSVAPDKIDAYRDMLVAKGVDCTPVVNHDDVVTGAEARTAAQATDKTWLRSFYFFDPDGIMLELCATVNDGLPHVDLPVNAEGIKSDGRPITGA